MLLMIGFLKNPDLFEDVLLAATAAGIQQVHAVESIQQEGLLQGITPLFGDFFQSEKGGRYGKVLYACLDSREQWEQMLGFLRDGGYGENQESLGRLFLVPVEENYRL